MFKFYKKVTVALIALSFVISGCTIPGVSKPKPTPKPKPNNKKTIVNAV